MCACISGNMHVMAVAIIADYTNSHSVQCSALYLFLYFSIVLCTLYFLIVAPCAARKSKQDKLVILRISSQCISLTFYR